MTTKYPHGFRSPLDKSPESNVPRPGEDTSTWACPPTPVITDDEAYRRYREEVVLFSGWIDPNDRYDWRGIAIGFFIGIGLTVDNAMRLAAEAWRHE